MKRLLLLRHAKSSWEGPAQDDHDRILNARGRAAAVALGRWIVDQGLVPGEILCSSAMRTRETVLRLDLGAPVSLRPALYNADAATIRHEIQSASAQTVLVVGHNPGIATCAASALRQPPNHPRFHDYPTGALTIAGFPDQEWSVLQWGSGTCLNFVIPAELE